MTDKITIDRTVLEQALCFAKAQGDVGTDEWIELATNLRAALEQPQVEQEAVWHHKHWGEGDDIFYRPTESVPDGAIPLYTHPQPPRQPLTDVQIDDMFAHAGTGEYLAERERIRHLEIYSFGVRDAEAAHGIAI